MAALIAAPGLAAAQAASKAETQAVNKIVECLIQGVPEDWQRVEMIVELAKPGAETGDVQYLVTRAETADKQEPFTPCDLRQPVFTLLDARKALSPSRRNWTAAKLVLLRDGKFGLNYDYPKGMEPKPPGKKK